MDLMKAMLNYNPDARPTALDALRHPYFSTSLSIPRNPENQEVTPQPPSSNRPNDISNFSRPGKEGHKGKPKGDVRLSVYERMKKARYTPGVVCK